MNHTDSKVLHPWPGPITGPGGDHLDADRELQAEDLALRIRDHYTVTEGRAGFLSDPGAWIAYFDLIGTAEDTEDEHAEHDRVAARAIELIATDTGAVDQLMIARLDGDVAMRRDRAGQVWVATAPRCWRVAGRGEAADFTAQHADPTVAVAIRAQRDRDALVRRDRALTRMANAEWDPPRYASRCCPA